MNPYRSGCLIESIPNPDPEEPDLPKIKSAYQSICGLINWLAILTHPDAATVLSFLASYQGEPNHGDYEAALNALRYLVNTSSFGISYHSGAPTFTKSFVHFPPHHNMEAYTGATPPRPDKYHESTSYSDACWGSQIGKSVPDGT